MMFVARRRDYAVTSVVEVFLLAALLLPWGVSGGFIDMDTPLDKRTIKSLVDDTEYHLVMSDEFNTPNRSFTDGHDPIWTALDKPDDDSSSAGGGSQQFYNSSYVTTTEDGMLKISTEISKSEWRRYDPIKKEYKDEEAYFNSGMLQSWEKFCFTGGIIEVDIILPGDPYIGGLWPAVWMLGNLGRATYEASTNNIWPWSFDKCDRKLQPAQSISACNEQNHFGMHAFQGRGATEIDLIEVMTGDSNGNLAGTDPPLALPYCDMTLQVAPGITKNRPSCCTVPLYEESVSPNGHTQLAANTWYEHLEMHGNTSINPFFYGTYMGKTKPGEPVTRTEAQAFQADAVGVAHQLTAAHFNKVHTFRVEWQPGAGGRIDWYGKAHKIDSETTIEGDGNRDDWLHIYGIKDKSLKDLTGAQIPIEPSSLVLNIAVSSTWGFPTDVKDSCEKCYDCDDPKCSCAFAPGFCKMLRETDVAMYVDSIRVYQSRDPSAHVGANHTLGCDPLEYPTKEWIKGHSYQYMRNSPFSYEDKGIPLKKVQKGGGKCHDDSHCGAHITNVNLTEVEERSRRHLESEDTSIADLKGRGKCVPESDFSSPLFKASSGAKTVCNCNPGYTGPHCLAQEHIDHTVSAHKEKMKNSVFNSIPSLYVSPVLLVGLAFILAIAIVFACRVAGKKRREKEVERELSSKFR
mmetsp:Transcript_6792/g.15392  ORF Transcript_6792/g.15392 Transcript_6792/m.15392 type:complete len:687 (+) Transcript_6792:232-2292(+)